MSVTHVPQMSLMPNMERQSKIGIPVSTLRVLALALLMVSVAVGAGVYTGRKTAAVKADLTNAEAEQTTLQQQKRQLKAQYAGLVAQGGAGQVDRLKGVINSRLDYAAFAQDLAQAIPAGVKIETAFNLANPSAPLSTLSTPASTADASGGAGATFQWTCTAPTKAAMDEFITRLRSDRRWFNSVELVSASRGGRPIEGTGVAVMPSSNASLDPDQISFLLNVGWNPPPAQGSAPERTSP